MEMPQIHRPIPRRTFELTPASTDSSHPPSPTPEMTNPELLMEKRADLSPSRTRSILNLTSSTLLGIYSPTGLGETRDELSTPWGTGAQTPIHRRSVDYWRPELEPVTWNGPGTKPKSQNRVRKSGFRGYYVPLAFQTALLFLSGIAYGSITTHLHKTQHITPVPVPSSDRTALYYHITWGILGVLLGNALPIVDDLWEDTVTPNSNGVIVKNKSRQSDSKEKSSDEHGHHPSSESGVDPIWYSTVRSVGAFVGIAFAVRRIPWQSTLQVSSTLALSNPVLWYIIDRSVTGLLLSTSVSIIGTIILVLVSPGFVPVPAIHQNIMSEQIGVYMWLASILFCTSLCFGAIGRKLQL